MSETEASLSPDERLTIVALYARLSQSQNRSVPGRLGSDRACYADHDICSPETLSHSHFPVSRGSEGFRSC